MDANLVKHVAIPNAIALAACAGAIFYANIKAQKINRACREGEQRIVEDRLRMKNWHRTPNVWK